MKLVRCNHCKNEYYICPKLDKLGFPLGVERCDCGATDYVILEDNIKVAYSRVKDDMDTQQEDIRHSLLLFKEELNELIKTYIEPFLK